MSTRKLFIYPLALGRVVFRCSWVVCRHGILPMVGQHGGWNYQESEKRATSISHRQRQCSEGDYQILETRSTLNKIGTPKLLELCCDRLGTRKSKVAGGVFAKTPTLKSGSAMRYKCKGVYTNLIFKVLPPTYRAGWIRVDLAGVRDSRKLSWDFQQLHAR